ncbi:MrcB family domain-containing protein [Paenibacillus psychroresistens]|uniref:MrcB family domain-containing protein n=1 Tax=Paenibacillus psychroresistens TaxID=1778678 RepID=UPI00139112E1|nr:DUF3578 domain-containing protein [Paenibacillus psychroresistens]
MADFFLSDKLKALRLQHGKTQMEVSQAIGISYSTLSRVESEGRSVDSDILIKIAAYYKVSIDELLGLKLAQEIELKEALQNNSKIREEFEFVLSNYNRASKETFKDHVIGDFIRNRITRTLKEEALLSPNTYKLTGSIGQGQWAEVPWISVFLKNVTLSAQKGYYIVFLFKADMSGFYISLNQGWTYYKDKYGIKLGREKIQKVVNMLREEILHNIPNELSTETIDLKARGDLGIGYENGHICGKYYAADSLPSSEILIQDLKQLLLVYDEIQYLISNRTVEQFNDFLLFKEDKQFLEDSEQESDFQETVQETIAEEIKTVEQSLEKEENSEDRREPLIDTGGAERWPRDAKKAAQSLFKAKYQCAFDNSHHSFISKITRKSYMEAHHLIPMGLQRNFKKMLDKSGNIVSLCPNCHRLIHHGIDSDRLDMLRKLFYERRDKLERLGLEITFSNLCEAYGIVPEM